MLNSHRLGSILAVAAGEASIVSGSIFPYASAPERLPFKISFRILFPAGVPLGEWLIPAIPALVAIAIGLPVMVQFVRRMHPDRFVAGLLIGTGIMAIAYFLRYAVQTAGPQPTRIVWVGLVGVAGGILLSLGGWFEAALTRRSAL